MKPITTPSDNAAGLAALSDDDLVKRVNDLAACERRASVALIRSLVEFDKRRLYLREGCSSLFGYCTQMLHLSEGSSYNRIEAARAALRYPKVLESLDRGDLTLTAVRLLAPHLTPANHSEVLAAAKHRSKQGVQELIASLNPRPAVATIIRRAPQPSNGDTTPAVAAAQELRASVTTTEAVSPPASSARQDVAATQAPQCRATVVTPLATELYRLQVTLPRETHDKLRRAQALARHALPGGDVGSILDRALTLLIDDLERRRFAHVASPQPSRGDGTASGRHIPAAVRRAVWQRDQERCAFVGRAGRCRETAFLEFHHLTPYATGGDATVENIQLRCRAHNQYEARLFFGDRLLRERQPPWIGSAGTCSGTGAILVPPREYRCWGTL
jgi:5-methylcytosine-specific restriction endonuclease McrA